MLFSSLGEGGFRWVVEVEVEVLEVLELRLDGDWPMMREQCWNDGQRGHRVLLPLRDEIRCLHWQWFSDSKERIERLGSPSRNWVWYRP